MRCWDRAALDLPPGLVLLTGPNGAGKTSLVEAVVLGCLGVSPRTAREAEVVRRGAPALHVTLDLDGPPGLQHREIGFAPGAGRRLRRDGVPGPVAGRVARPGGPGVPARRAAGGEGAAGRAPPGPGPGAGGLVAGLRRRPGRLPARPGPAQRAAAAGARRARRPRTACRRGRRRWPPSGPGSRRRAGPAWRRSRGRSPTGSPSWAAARRGGWSWSRRRRGARRCTRRRLEAYLLRILAERRPREIAAAQTLSGPHRDDLLIAAGAGRPAPRGLPGRAAHRGPGAAPGRARPPARAGGPADPAARRRAQRARPAPPPAAAGGGARRGPDDRHDAPTRGPPTPWRSPPTRSSGWRRAASPPDRHPRRRRRRPDPMGAAEMLGRFRRRSGGPPGRRGGRARGRRGAASWAGRGRPHRARCAAAAPGCSRWRAPAPRGRRSSRCGATSWCALLAAAAPDAGVTGLRFAVADHVPARRGPAAAPAAPAATRPGARERALGEGAAAGIADPAVRDLVARAAAAAEARRMRPASERK